MIKLLVYSAATAIHQGVNSQVQTENALQEVKGQVKMVLRRITRNSEPQASIESGPFTIQLVFVLNSALTVLTTCFVAI
jgi:hypothetical protein